MLTEDSSIGGWTNRWRDLEPNPFDTSVQRLDGRSSGGGPTDVGETLTVFPAEDQLDELRKESLVQESTSGTIALTDDGDDADGAGQRAAVEAFQAAVTEARQEAETQLTAAVAQVRQEEAERHAAEFARVREELERQHADDLQQVRKAAVESFKALTGNVLRNV